jgi:glutathione S-transferase
MAGGEALRNFSSGFENRVLTGPRNFKQIPELVERGRLRLEGFMEVLDRRLAKSPCVALDRFTMADIGGYVCVDFASWIKLPVREKWPNIRRWSDEIAVRPSASA